MRFALTIAIAIVVAATSTDVIAACNKRSLTGEWHYFANTQILDEDFLTVMGSAVEDCHFTITKKGVVKDIDCSDGTDKVVWSIDDIDFAIMKDCSISVITDTCQISGQISPNKEVVSGIGVCCCFENEAGSGNFVLPYHNVFNLTKIRR
jgi:hypothetical protein